MAEQRLGRKVGLAAPGVAAVDERTARICRLLEEAARQGEQGLQLLAEARAIYASTEPCDDGQRAGLLRDLARRLQGVEREGRRRLRQAQTLLHPAARLRLVRP